MKLSIIIPCYNAAATLGAQLNALVSQEWSEPWEILVVDNGSTDNSLALIKHYRLNHPRICSIHAAGRPGAAHARNAGAKQARGEYLVFIDADDIAHPGWVAAIGHALDHYDAVASRFDITSLNPEWLIQALPHPQTKGLQQINYPPFLPHASGSGISIHRDIHESLGGFNEQLRYLEDTDYCFRLQAAGYALHYEPAAIVAYRYRTTFRSLLHQNFTWAEYNVLLARMHSPPRQTVNLRQAWKLYLRTWYSLVRRLLKMRTPAQRAVALSMLGWQLGVLEGCLKYRAFPLPPLGLIEEARKIYRPLAGAISKAEIP